MSTNESQQLRRMGPTMGLRRPNWIAQGRQQDIGLVRDRSLSMMGQKAEDESIACCELVKEVGRPYNKDAFRVAVIDFSGTSDLVHDFEKASVLMGTMKKVRVDTKGTGTDIALGLMNTVILLDSSRDYLENTTMRPVVILLTDGLHNAYSDPLKIADHLKKKADLLTVAFGDDADEELLKEIASTPKHFYRCLSGKELRAFLGYVGTSLTTAMHTSQSCTETLSRLPQQLSQ